MKLFAHVGGLTLALSILSFVPEQTRGQGTLQWTVTFDGSPPIAPGTGKYIPQYFEQDMWFRAIGPVPAEPPYHLARMGGGITGFPENGTAYLIFGFQDSLAVTSSSGQRFGLVSVDLAEFSTLYNFPRTVQFIGYKPDGTTVMTELTTDGVIDGTGPLADFQTFTFDSRFADLVRVEVPMDTWALDSMVFSQIPEPITVALLLTAGLLFWALRSRKS